MAFMLLSRIGEGLADRELDVRGWEVRTDLDDEKVGKVEDMLLDETGRPRYLDVDLGLFRKHVLLPVGRARADGRRDIVWVPGLTKDRIEGMPDWDGDPDRIDERRVAAAYRGEPIEEEGVAVSRDENRLAILDDLEDYRIPSNEPNPKGWAVVTGDGRRVGEVDGLIVDTLAMKVRYLDCDLDREKLGFRSDHERHVLLPVSHTRLDREEERVLLDGITADRLQDLPVYGGLPIGADFEERLQETFPADAPVDGGYSAPDDERFFAERRAQRALNERAAPDPRDRAHDRITGEQRPAADAAAKARGSAAERELRPDLDSAGTGETSTRLGAGEEVRIRVRGDQIIVEKRPRE
jgi:sporulation protein YlmC with PRC-barrel domain